MVALECLAYFVGHDTKCDGRDTTFGGADLADVGAGAGGTTGTSGFFHSGFFFEALYEAVCIFLSLLQFFGCVFNRNAKNIAIVRPKLKRLSIEAIHRLNKLFEVSLKLEVVLFSRFAIMQPVRVEFETFKSNLLAVAYGAHRDRLKC